MIEVSSNRFIKLTVSIRYFWQPQIMFLIDLLDYYKLN